MYRGTLERSSITMVGIRREGLRAGRGRPSRSVQVALAEPKQHDTERSGWGICVVVWGVWGVWGVGCV